MIPRDYAQRRPLSPKVTKSQVIMTRTPYRYAVGLMIKNWLRVSHIGLCYCRVWRNLVQEVESTRGTRGQ
jgi:hypothetical protein